MYNKPFQGNGKIQIVLQCTQDAYIVWVLPIYKKNIVWVPPPFFPFSQILFSLGVSRWSLLQINHSMIIIHFMFAFCSLCGVIPKMLLSFCFALLLVFPFCPLWEIWIERNGLVFDNMWFSLGRLKSSSVNPFSPGLPLQWFRLGHCEDFLFYPLVFFLYPPVFLLIYCAFIDKKISYLSKKEKYTLVKRQRRKNKKDHKYVSQPNPTYQQTIKDIKPISIYIFTLDFQERNPESLMLIPFIFE